jgi:hypothetical protein
MPGAGSALPGASEAIRMPAANASPPSFTRCRWRRTRSALEDDGFATRAVNEKFLFLFLDACKHELFKRQTALNLPLDGGKPGPFVPDCCLAASKRNSIGCAHLCILPS